MDSDDGVPYDILGEDLSSLLEDLTRKPPYFAFVVSEMGLDPEIVSCCQRDQVIPRRTPSTI